MAINEQESSPAWPQEAYRPPCSKYSLCCCLWGVSQSQFREGTPVPAEGYPSSSLGGTPGKGAGTKRPGKEPETGVPLWIDKQTKIITFIHPSDAGSNKLFCAKEVVKTFFHEVNLASTNGRMRQLSFPQNDIEFNESWQSPKVVWLPGIPRDW